MSSRKRSRLSVFLGLITGRSMPRLISTRIYSRRRPTFPSTDVLFLSHVSPRATGRYVQTRQRTEQTLRALCAKSLSRDNGASGWTICNICIYIANKMKNSRFCSRTRFVHIFLSRVSFYSLNSLGILSICETRVIYLEMMMMRCRLIARKRK